MTRINEVLGRFSDQTSVSRWLVNTPNPGTRKVYLYALERYVGFTGKEPDELVASGRESGEYAHDLLKMFYNSLNLASKSKMAVYQSIRSFDGANRVVLGRKPRTFKASAEYELRNLYT